MSVRRLAVFCCAVVLVLAIPLPAGANHSWGGYHWARTSNPFTIRLGDNVSSAWDTYLDTASRDWTKSSVLDAPIRQGAAGNLRNCKPARGASRSRPR
jgi:hypothetical protein